MRFKLVILFVPATSASTQKVVGTAYCFGAGATGEGSAAAVAPTSNDGLTKLLRADVARTILFTKELDFTGETATGERPRNLKLHQGDLLLILLSFTVSAVVKGTPDPRCAKNVPYAWFKMHGTAGALLHSTKFCRGLPAFGPVTARVYSLGASADSL